MEIRIYCPYMLTIQTEEKLHQVNLSGESYRSLSLVLKIFETNPLRLCCGECVCARGVSLNVGVRSVRCEEGLLWWFRVLVSNVSRIRR
jgi:hypothetical protein